MNGKQWDDWQPIETAPRDGTLILAYTRRGTEIVYWGRDNAMNPLGWIGGHCAINHIDQPTKWLPLPAPPAPETTP